jgi:uncharacterized protein
MPKLIQVLERQFLALFFFFTVIISGFGSVYAQNLNNTAINRGVAYEKSSARDADLAKIPVLKSQVTDLTGTLTPSQVSSLEQKLAAFETQKGSQIAILIVSSTQPEAIEQYALRVVEKWQLGRKKIDDGILLLVAKDDRRLRFEVGYGLEGAVNDLTAKRIISEIITPYFRQGQFYEGINAGIDRLIMVVNGEDLPPPVPKSNSASYANDSGGVEGVLLIAFMASLFLGGVLKKILGKTLGGLTTAGIVGFLAFILTGIIGIAIIAGLIGFVASMMGGLGGRGGPIIFPGGGGGGFGGRGGFGGGGGGFGGGGGGFGGGGASGGW